MNIIQKSKFSTPIFCCAKIAVVTAFFMTNALVITTKFPYEIFARANEMTIEFENSYSTPDLLYSGICAVYCIPIVATFAVQLKFGLTRRVCHFLKSCYNAKSETYRWFINFVFSLIRNSELIKS